MCGDGAQGEALQALTDSIMGFIMIMSHTVRNCNIYMGEYAVLGCLMRLRAGGEGAVKSSDLSAKMSVAPPSATVMLNRMEEAGYIARERGKDRRVVLVSITPKGEKKFNEAEGKLKRVIGEIMTCLGQEKSGELAALMHEFCGCARRPANGKEVGNQ